MHELYSIIVWQCSKETMKGITCIYMHIPNQIYQHIQVMCPLLVVCLILASCYQVRWSFLREEAVWLGKRSTCSCTLCVRAGVANRLQVGVLDVHRVFPHPLKDDNAATSEDIHGYPIISSHLVQLKHEEKLDESLQRAEAYRRRCPLAYCIIALVLLCVSWVPASARTKRRMWGLVQPGDNEIDAPIQTCSKLTVNRSPCLKHSKA